MSYSSPPHVRLVRYGGSRLVSLGSNPNWDFWSASNEADFFLFGSLRFSKEVCHPRVGGDLPEIKKSAPFGADFCFFVEIGD
mgnify:CR=1 FL=1